MIQAHGHAHLPHQSADSFAAAEGAFLARLDAGENPTQDHEMMPLGASGRLGKLVALVMHFVDGVRDVQHDPHNGQQHGRGDHGHHGVVTAGGNGINAQRR